MFYYGVKIIAMKNAKDSSLEFVLFDDYTEYLKYKFHPNWVIFESANELDNNEIESRFTNELRKNYL